MGQKKSEKELFEKSKASLQEIAGWKVFIFLPLNTFWRLFVVMTVIAEFVMVLTRCVYSEVPMLYDFVDLLCDLVYTADVTFASMHYVMRKTRKLKYGSKRNVGFLLIDYVSLVPFERTFDYYLYNNVKYDERVPYYLSLVKLLRIYQFPLSFRDLKLSVYNLNTYVALQVFELILYYIIFTHFLSCFIFLNFNEEQKKKCVQKFLYCVLENSVVTFFLLQSDFVPPLSGYSLEDFKTFVITIYFIGYVFTYGYVMPNFIFGGLKLLCRYFEKYQQLEVLKITAVRSITDKVLKKKVLNRIDIESKFGRSKILDEVMRIFPLGMKKNICCDMHWEAFRHSILLQDLTMGCKRSLATCMTTEFVTPKSTVFEKDLDWTYFLYVGSGSLHIMAEENGLVPVFDVSSGTVLGEICFFLLKKPVATVQAAKFSVVHVLKFRDFFKVIANYPNDKLRVLRKVRARLAFAKSVHRIKSEVCSLIDLKNNANLEETKVGNIKWIKKQCRAISNVKNTEALMNLNRNNQNFIDDYQRQVNSLGTQMDHTSVFLRLISFSDQKEQQHKAVCVKSSFPWLMNPNCYFLVVWESIVLVAMFYTICVYPAVIGYSAYIPRWFYTFSIVISFIFTIDVILPFFTAIRSKNNLIKNSSVVLTHRIVSLKLYCSILAAIPFQLFMGDIEVRFNSNLYFGNALIKSYIIIPTLHRWSRRGKNYAFIRVLTKYMLFLALLIYLCSALYNLTGVECVFFDCGTTDWFHEFILKSNGTIDPVYASIFKSVFLVFEIPEKGEPTDVGASLALFTVLYILAHFVRLTMKGRCTASYVLNLTHGVYYKILMDFVHNFLEEHKLMGMIHTRVMNTMQFNWDLDRGNAIVGKEQLWDVLSGTLARETDHHLKLPYVENCRLFQWEKEDFLMDICERASRLVLPANSVLLTLGTQTRCLYIIQKGFVQVNSFVRGDLNLNTARPITVRQGDIFPVIDVLSQTPVAVTAVTTSDCELLLLDLEDVLTVMMTHGVFKDVVESVQETNISLLTSAKLGMCVYQDVFSYDKNSRKNVFYKIKCLGVILNFLLKKRAIDSNSITYIRWELFCVLHIMISLVVWPIVYSFSRLHRNLYILYLTGLGFLTFPDFYIRLHVAYYNKMGIYVTHTLFTTLHYLSTSFFVDFIAFAPNFHAIYIYARHDFINFEEFVIHMAMRSLSLYRFIGFLSHMRTEKRSVYQDHLFVPLSLFLLAVHYYVCVMVYLHMANAHEEVFRLTQENIEINIPYEYYISELSILITVLLRGHCYVNNYNLNSAILHISLSSLGLVAVIILYSQLTLRSTTVHSSLTNYQHYMHSFLRYLKMHKAEDFVIKQGVEHFENEWTQQGGHNMLSIFSKFPQTLHEDVMLPLYRKTLRGVESLSKANEYFYRTLAKNADEVFLKKESVVIFQREVQSNIYFVHKGQCLVENSTVILYKGAMIGDVKRNGLMKNTIIAKTDLTLLKVSSSLFFLTLNNFYATKVAFMAEALEADDFVKSIYTEPEDPEPVIITAEKEFLECEFVSEMNEEIVEKVLKKKTRTLYMQMGTKKDRFLRFCFLLIAYASLLIIPVFMAVRLVTPLTRAIVYGLDALWIIKLILNSRIIRYNKEDTKLSKKKKRLKSAIGTTIRVASVLPIEVLPLAYYGLPITDHCCYTMSFFYVNRLLRIYFIFSYFAEKGKKLVTNFKMTVLEIFIIKFVMINICCCVNIGLNVSNLFEPLKCYHSLSQSQLDAIPWSYVCVLNTFLNGSLWICLPNNLTETVFQMFIAAWALFSKAFFINNVLMIKFVSFHNKSIQMNHLQKLRNYLMASDVSPVLIQKTEIYFSCLFNAYAEGTEPLFLRNAPAHLKVTIMENLYMSHLEGCYFFKNVDEVFLKQLTTRMFLNVFYPGDYITEKGDVDNNMYFIKQGEVYCIETDETYSALETATNLYIAGNYFGELQGILSCYPHTQTYRAKTITHILVLNFNRWEDLRVAFPEVSEEIFRKCLSSLNA